MPIPIGILAPLIVGGGMAASEVGSRMQHKRAMEDMDKKLAILKQLQGGEEPFQVSGVGGAQEPTAVPQTVPPQLALEPQTGAGLIQQPEQRPAQGQPRGGIPRTTMDTTFNLDTGNLSVQVKQNAEYFKMVQQQNAMKDYSDAIQQEILQGTPIVEARKKAFIKSTIQNGLVLDPNQMKTVYPDMTENERYNAVRNNMITLLENGVDFERARIMLGSLFPDTSVEQWKQAAQEIYELRKAELMPWAMAVKEQEGLQGAAQLAEAEVLAAQMAGDQNLKGYLSDRQRAEIEPRVTRISDIANADVRDYLMSQYGKDAIVSQGVVNITRDMVEGLATQREAERKRQTTIAGARAAAGAQAEQIEPLVADLEEMALALNTETDVLARLISKGELSAYALLQKSPETVMVGGEQVNVGVLAADYAGATKSFLGQMARTFSGERGVLTNQDIDRIKAAIPKLGDSKGLTERKMRRLRSHLQEIMQRADIAMQTGKRPANALPDEEINKLLTISNDEIIAGGVNKIKSLSNIYGGKKK